MTKRPLRFPIAPPPFPGHEFEIDVSRSTSSKRLTSDNRLFHICSWSNQFHQTDKRAGGSIQTRHACSWLFARTFVEKTLVDLLAKKFRSQLLRHNSRSPDTDRRHVDRQTPVNNMQCQVHKRVHRLTIGTHHLCFMSTSVSSPVGWRYTTSLQCQSLWLLLRVIPAVPKDQSVPREASTIIRFMSLKDVFLATLYSIPVMYSSLTHANPTANIITCIFQLGAEFVVRAFIDLTVQAVHSRSASGTVDKTRQGSMTPLLSSSFSYGNVYSASLHDKDVADATYCVWSVFWETAFDRKRHYMHPKFH